MPSGVLTFLLTDIEDSTAKWRVAPEAMGLAVARHETIITRAVAANSGVNVRAQGEGDSTLSAFPRAADALAAAMAIQRDLASEQWPAVDISVRIGVHTGEAEFRDGSYFGITLNHTGRVRGLGRGGQIVVSAVTAELARHGLPPGFALHDAGRHLLKGIVEPQRVFTLAPEGDASAAQLASRPWGSVRGAIPTAPTSFVGRAGDVAAIVAALETKRIVTVTGPGGAGKTRLAVEAAHVVRDTGRAVVLVDLASVTESGAVADAIAAAAEMDVSELPDHDQLVVLDNCEQVVGAVAELVAAALRGDCRSSFVVTTQTRLGISAEHIVDVGPLAIDEAVELFIDRARALDSEVDPDRDREAIVAICALVDRLPLAIELAAGQVRLMAPREIRDRLTKDVFALAGDAPRGAPDRQRTLTAAIEWSIGLADEDERTLLARLAVFQGGFTLGAAEAVCADERLPSRVIPDVLLRLVDRSLVSRRRSDGEVRFGLLESVKTYVWSRLRERDTRDRVVMRREGELWVVAVGDVTVRLRDSLGLRYIAELVRRPQTEIAAAELAGVPPEAGFEGLDDRARRAYRERLRDLELERDEATANNDPERRASAEAEIDALITELSRAVGRSGRARPTGSASERARVSVTKAIRQAIGRVDAVAPPVADHLNASIVTGAWCAYNPSGPAITIEL